MLRRRENKQSGQSVDQTGWEISQLLENEIGGCTDHATDVIVSAKAGSCGARDCHGADSLVLAFARSAELKIQKAQR